MALRDLLPDWHLLKHVLEDSGILRLTISVKPAGHRPESFAKVSTSFGSWTF